MNETGMNVKKEKKNHIDDDGVLTALRYSNMYKIRVEKFSN